MKQLLETYLKQKGALSDQLPEVIKQVGNSIHAGGLPARMKLTIAFAEIMLYTGHFRRHILHWNGSIIPINAITLLLAGSGKGKDRAIKEARRCFNSGYKLLEQKREELARQEAERLAAEAGEEDPATAWKEYYKKPLDLFTAATNSAAFLDHLADLEKSSLGAGVILSSEFGTELQSNADILTTIKDISELYDMGDRETKPLKDRARQTAAIKCMPVNALLVSSADNILYDDSTKKKIKQEMSTKLGRRTNFAFITEDKKLDTDIDSSNMSPEQITQIVKQRALSKIQEENAVLATRHNTDMATMAVTQYQLKNNNKPIAISEEARELFETYLDYNEILSEEISKLYPISKIVRAHMQWKALKLAGAIAFFANSEVITEQHYIEAINFTELLEEDMEAFETELVKEPYELFVKYMHSIEENGAAKIGLHKLRKMGYIPTTGKAQNHIKELIELASSYDKSGIHTATEDGIEYKKIVKTNASGVSYVAVSGSKEQRAKQCASGYQFIELEFQALAGMLKGDYAYSPFQFIDGKRGKEYITGGCKWVSLDIDKSILMDTEVHQLLQDYNHHIVRTSNADNAFKFRVLLELDSYVNESDKIWKHFIKSIAEHLSLQADLLPKSQIFFSYAGREVLSQTEAKPLDVKEHLLYAHSRDHEVDKPQLTKGQKAAKLADPMDTFNFAYEAPDGEGSLRMWSAAKKAHEYGASKQECIDLIHDINNFWVCSMDATRLQNTILSQIERLYEGT
jgi:hypothetical protein